MESTVASKPVSPRLWAVKWCQARHTQLPVKDLRAGAPLSASPAIAAGYLVIGSQDGVLYALR